MRDMGLVKNDEPVERLFTQGMIIKGGAKMSKSLGNVVSPDEMVEHYGADSTRMYTLFATSPDRELDWQDEGVEGIRALPEPRLQVRRPQRLQRLESYRGSAALNASVAGSASNPAQAAPDHQARERRFPGPLALQHLHRRHHGTGERTLCRRKAVSRATRPRKPCPCRCCARSSAPFALLLAPFAPYLAHELWEMLGEKGSLLRESPVGVEKVTVISKRKWWQKRGKRKKSLPCFAGSPFSEAC